MEGEGSRNEGKDKDKKRVLVPSTEEEEEEISAFEVVKEVVELIEKSGSYVGFRKTQKKECLNLVRKLKLLMPLMEEIVELHPSISNDSLSSLLNLKKSLLASKKLLKTCISGSKIFLVSKQNSLSPPLSLSLSLMMIPFFLLGTGE